MIVWADGPTERSLQLFGVVRNFGNGSSQGSAAIAECFLLDYSFGMASLAAYPPLATQSAHLGENRFGFFIGIKKFG